VKLTDGRLRSLFNNERFVQRARSAQIQMIVAEDKLVERAWAGGKVRRLIVKFYDAGVLVAVANRWRYPDGRPAASGRFDPKMVVKDRITYWTGAEPKPKDPT
jgi:hypothetical protein